MPNSAPGNLSAWRELFAKADQFRNQEPWTVLDDDTQLFGVVDLSTNTTYYCCVIGNAGQVFGLIAYRGESGYAIHYKMYHSEVPPELSPDLGFEQDCLMAEFTYRDELSAFDRSLIKQLGLKYRGFGYPKFSDFKPGMFPEKIHDAQISLLKDCLAVGLIVHDGVSKNSRFLKKKNHIRTWKKDSSSEWTESWVKAPTVKATKLKVNSNELRVSELKKMKLKRSGIWEAGVVFFPGKIPMGDGRFYMPRLCVVADQKSGFIFSHRLLEPTADASLSILNALLDAIKSSGHIPNEVFVQNEETAQYLLPTLDDLDIEVYQQAVLPAIHNMQQEMSDHFRSL